jgi:hypothetical protein
LTRRAGASYARRVVDAACEAALAVDRTSNLRAGRRPPSRVTSQASPDLLLLLYSDRSDAVARALLDHPGRFGREVFALSLDQLVEATCVGSAWRVAGRAIEPARTAVVNRLVAPPAGSGHRLVSYAAGRQFWTWLERELTRFAYATSRPTATSLTGCHGSLLDQWTDLPALVDGLRVPAHRSPWSAEPLDGDVFRVDPWHLYSLGTPAAPGDATRDGRLAYARPRGRLVHVAQVGGLVLFAAMPADMTRAQQSYIVSFAQAMAARSDVRILEHAFFVGDGPPVFYSTCPFPVITGSLAEYPQLVAQGLADDIARRAGG